MSIISKRILVTGSGGFVGSHLVEALLLKGYTVKCMVHYNSRNDCGLLSYISQKLIKDVEIISGDLRDYHAVSQALKRIDIVFHLGALIAIPYSYKHPKDVIDTNIMGTFNVLNAAKEHSINKVIHTSTSEVYGTAKYVPINEEHPLQAQSPYSASKISADKIADSFWCSYNLPVATIRPFNTYGPRQSARAVIPTMIIQALTQDTMHLGSLTPTRDYTYVSDTVEAFIQIAKNDQAIGKTYNIGSNMEISIGDLAKKVCDVANPNCKVIQEKKRMRPNNSEVERLWADNSKALKELEWKPRVSLEEGLCNTISWIKDNIHRYQTKEYVI